MDRACTAQIVDNIVMAHHPEELHREWAVMVESLPL